MDDIILVENAMAIGSTRRNSDVMGGIGPAVYAERVRPLPKPEDHGKFVAIDVNSGEFELDEDDYIAVERLASRLPSAEIWVERAGYPTACEM